MSEHLTAVWEDVRKTDKKLQISYHGKLFTFGATPVFSRIIHTCILYC